MLSIGLNGALIFLSSARSDRTQIPLVPERNQPNTHTGFHSSTSVMGEGARVGRQTLFGVIVLTQTDIESANKASTVFTVSAQSVISYRNVAGEGNLCMCVRRPIHSRKSV